MPRFKGDLTERTYRFALRILELVDQFPNTPKGWALTRQLLRSGTSIGANVQEADGALTDREFAQLCNIARREAGESRYWLRLARDGGLLSGSPVEKCLQEAIELASILATIVRKTQERLRAKVESQG